MTVTSYGDIVVPLCLIKNFKEKHQGKILFITIAQMYDFAKFFKEIDDIIVVSKNYILYKIDKKTINSSRIVRGKIFILWCKDIFESKYKINNIINRFSYILKFKNRIDDINTRLNIHSGQSRMKYNNYAKDIFLFPEANALNYKILSSNFWKELYNTLQTSGYNPIINTNSDEYKNYNCVFQSITNTIKIASKCKAVISFRSGILDILAISIPNKIFSIYPSDIHRVCLVYSDDKEKKFIKSNYSIYINNSLAQTELHLYSLKKIYKRKDIEEVLFNGNEEELISQINNFINK